MVAAIAGLVSAGRAEPQDALGFEVPPAAEADASSASRYANMTSEAALRELELRGISFERVDRTPGVRTPVRLTGALHGVAIHSSLPADQWRATPFEILDARLALALDDFARILALHDVVEVVHFTMYRPPDAKGESPDALDRHPGGLAIDVGALRKRNGARLVVAEHWPASIGAKTCGPRARLLPGRRGRELESLVCEASDARLFHAILTPHHNRAHHDHLHLEIKPDTRWFLVR